MRLVLLALALILGWVTAPARATEPTPFFLDNNIVPKIVCGQWMGTGIFVGRNLIATAKHVVAAGGCKVGSVAATVVYQSPTNDFALVRTPLWSPLRAIISCHGFQEDGHYFATGYADDAARTVTQRWLGSSSRSRAAGFEGLMIFRGSATGGMSGGPINDEDGATAGIVEANTEDGITIALGLSFADTPLCTKELRR